MNKLITLFIIILFISCKKEPHIMYSGTVVGLGLGCSLPLYHQFPYKIKLDDITQLDVNHDIRTISLFDSSIIAIIPQEYQIPGKKIKFDFRKCNPNEEFTCNANVAYYQAIITKINNY